MFDQHIIIGEKEKAVNSIPKTTFGKHIWNSIVQQKFDSFAEANGLSDERLTYGEMIHQGKALCKTLSKLGCGPDDVVVVCCANHLAFTPCLLGCLWNGNPCAPINVVFSLADYQHILSNYAPKVIIASKEVYPCLKEAYQRSLQQTHFAQFIIIGSKEKHEDISNCLFLSDIWKEPVLDNDNFLPFDLPERELRKHCCVILPSSGSTGPPKGVRHTHKSLIYSFYLNSLTCERFTSFISLTGGYWITGILTRYLTIIHGALNVLLEFECETFLQSVEKYKPEMAIITVGYLGELMKFDWTPYNTNSLKKIFYGGAKLPLYIAKLVEEKQIKAYNGYGMTEILFLHTTFRERIKKRSIGKLISGACAKIVSVDSGVSLPANNNGELYIRSDSLMQGYHNNPATTSSTIDEQGWLHTGDLAYYDEEGYFYIVDRIKELIKYQSIHVNASEIEGLIYTQNGVIEVCVVGIPHPLDWEHAKAFVVRNTSSKITEEDIINFVKDHLPKYKWLHAGVQFVDMLPKTASGKYLRREIREMHQITAH